MELLWALAPAKVSVSSGVRTSHLEKLPFNVAANYVADGGEGAKSDAMVLACSVMTPTVCFLSQVGYGNRKWYVVCPCMPTNTASDGSTPAMGYSTDLQHQAIR